MQSGEPRRDGLVRLVAWFSAFAVVAVLLGRFAAFPWKASGLLLIPLELATLCAVMVEDDWEHDFRGDRRVFVRGTAANLLVVAGFTAIGVALRGLYVPLARSRRTCLAPSSRRYRSVYGPDQGRVAVDQQRYRSGAAQPSRRR